MKTKYMKSNLYESDRIELLKLYVLLLSEDRELVSREYLLSKIRGSLHNCPLVLHPLLEKKYFELRDNIPESEADPTIVEMVIEALTIDGSHHKQEYLIKIAKHLNIDLHELDYE